MRAHPHFNPFSVREPSELPDWEKVFAKAQPLDLEIGFSNGTWLVDYAKRFPKRNIVGVEIRKKFIEVAKEKIANEKLTNAYVLQANINTALPKLFKDIKLEKVFILFPDPWYKKGHLKRRVISPEFLKVLPEFMTASGQVYIATDKKEFALEMLALLEVENIFFNLAGKGNFAENTISGIVTDIEKYHLRLGNPLYRLAFQRTIKNT